MQYKANGGTSHQGTHNTPGAHTGRTPRFSTFIQRRPYNLVPAWHSYQPITATRSSRAHHAVQYEVCVAIRANHWTHYLKEHHQHKLQWVRTTMEAWGVATTTESLQTLQETTTYVCMYVCTYVHNHTHSLDEVLRGATLHSTHIHQSTSHTPRTNA